MTHFVNQNCIMCKYTDCVEVCPVDCFFEHEKMLLIDPDQCIDCGVCIPECPIDAIQNEESYVDGKSVEDISKSDTKDLTPKQLETLKMIHFNKDESKKHPNITKIKNPMKNADLFKGKEGKIGSLT